MADSRLAAIALEMVMSEPSPPSRMATLVFELVTSPPLSDLTAYTVPYQELLESTST